MNESSDTAEKGLKQCSRCGENDQLPTGTLCTECVRNDLAEYDEGSE